MPVGLRRSVPCKNWALHLLACLPHCAASIRFLFVRPGFAYGFLQIPPHDGHPCGSANTSPCRVCRGLSPPSECALPGAPTKKRQGRPPAALTFTILRLVRLFLIYGLLQLGPW